MELLPDFKLHQPATVEEAVTLWADNEGAQYLAGGTDLLVNVRRGIVAPRHLIGLDGIAEMVGIEAGEDGCRIGAGMRLNDLADNGEVRHAYTAVTEAAGAVAGPTHRDYGTLGGNLCLDTRCVYYNQSEWWRKSNAYCLKSRGEICHVAPGGKRCFAAFSGDVAPALLVHEAEIEVAGPDGRRRMALADLYRNDGMDHLTLQPGELLVAVHLPPAADAVSAYAKSRVRGSIDFPLAGAAVLLDGAGLRVALTGVSPQPFVVGKLDDLEPGAIDEAALAAIRDAVQSQAKAMKTTMTPPAYRRRVAGALARRLTHDLQAA